MATVWFDDRAEVLTFGRILDALDVFETSTDVLYYFEKPWKWRDEHRAWVNAGRPAVDPQPGEDKPTWWPS